MGERANQRGGRHYKKMADEGVTKLIVTAHPPGVGARTSLVRWAWKQSCLYLSVLARPALITKAIAESDH